MSAIKAFPIEDDSCRYDDIDDFIFGDVDEFLIPVFMTLCAGEENSFDFILKGKSGLSHHIRIEPPYKIHVERMCSVEDKKKSIPCIVLPFKG